MCVDPPCGFGDCPPLIATGIRSLIVQQERQAVKLAASLPPEPSTLRRRCSGTSFLSLVGPVLKGDLRVEQVLVTICGYHATNNYSQTQSPQIERAPE